MSTPSTMFSSRKRLRLSSPWVAYLALLADVAVINFVAIVAYGGYIGVYLWPHQMPSTYQLLIAAPAVLLVFQFDRLYRSWRLSHVLTMLWALWKVWSAILLMEVVLLFLSKSTTEVSRVWFLMFGAGTFLGLSALRLFAYYGLNLLRLQGYNYRNLLIVGQGPTSDEVMRVIEASAFSGFRVVGRIQPETLADYLASAQTAQIQEVWLCLPLSDEQNVKVALDALGHSTANIRLIPDWFSLRLMNHGMSERLGIPMLDISTSTLSGMSGLIKVIEDKVLAALILILISPLMLLIALAIKLTMGGPVLFKQIRHGWNGKLINVYKFRTMVLHTPANGEVVQATQNDPRVTRLGGFLRRTSLDELPQFVNVLQGKMSIVGPRPHAVAHNEHYKELVPRYMLRHKVKPGITGWAQVNGFRGEIDRLEKMERRVELDLYYIENMSLWFDLKIIFLTVFKGFVHRNAY
jgi:putative colanic acid biosynthesis UDP-glucose lipid carrier transferase